MEKIIYSSQRKAIDAIAKNYLLKIGFFDVTAENFSTDAACTSHIKDVVKKYNIFMCNVVDNLENVKEDYGYYVACYDIGGCVMEDSPELADKVDYEAFQHKLERKIPAVYFHYKPYENSVTTLTADEMAKRIACYKDYLD